MFNIVDYPPALGECSICKKHTCGTKEDGTQAWLHSPIELNVGGDLTIGYQCAKLIMNGFELSVEIIEKPILLTPTDEQIGDYMRSAINRYISPAELEHRQQLELELFNRNPSELNRAQLKEFLTFKNIPFVPQWGEERLREEALKHV